MPDQNPTDPQNPTVIPTTDTPPMAAPPEPVSMTAMDGSEVTPPPPIIVQEEQEAAGSAAPPFNLPEEMPKKKFGRGRLVATILGILILVGGLGAGLVLVKQQQDIREKAAAVNCIAISSIQTCQNTLGCAWSNNLCTSVPYCTRANQENCINGCEPTTTGGRCRTAPTATATPIPTSTAQPNCLGLGISICQARSDCYWSANNCLPRTATVTATATPIPTSTAQPNCLGLGISICQARSDCYWSANNCLPRTATATPTPYCSKFMNDDCKWGCNPSLSGGTCKSSPTCQTGQIVCNGSCVDPRYDSRNCGSCGRTCATGERCWANVCVSTTTTQLCPTGYTTGGRNRDAAEEACEGVCGVRETPTANRICENATIVNAGTAMVANWCYLCTGTAASGTQSPTTSLPPGEGPTAQCLNIRAFDTSWNVLSSTQLSALQAGNIVRFTVAGTATSGSFDKAKFKINGQETGEITTLKPGETAMYYYEYVIPEGVTAFTVGAKVHHTTLGWSN